jgi:hypothetical protein
MDICTAARTRKTTLLSYALEARAGWRAAADLQGRGDTRALVAEPAFQGGAIAVIDMAAVTPVVTDHTFSTRPGSSSCSPPV